MTRFAPQQEMGMNDKGIGLPWTAGSGMTFQGTLGWCACEVVGFGDEGECSVFFGAPLLSFSVKNVHVVNKLIISPRSWDRDF